MAELDLETEGIHVLPKLSPSQRFSRRVAIGELEKYVKEGLTSGELQRQHAVSIFQCFYLNGNANARRNGRKKDIIFFRSKVMQLCYAC
jgi:hypothetical protein